MVIPAGVTRIGDAAFYGCWDLTSIEIPDSVTSIGNEVFNHCESLTSVTIPAGVTRIGEWTFMWCRRLTNVTIPDRVRSIGNWAFYRCESLTNITIPDSVTSIGDEAFYGCGNLTSITIPSGVTTIGNKAFGECESLTSITILSAETYISDYAFRGCKNPTLHWLGTGETGKGVFAGLSCIIAPYLPLTRFSSTEQKRVATLGFLRAMEEYTDTAIRAEYVKYAAKQYKKLLPDIFAEDFVPALIFYAEQKKITAANFDTEYMTPALAANATGCAAFLLNWSNANISKDPI